MVFPEFKSTLHDLDVSAKMTESRGLYQLILQELIHVQNVILSQERNID
jgi:hypothetical protein